MVRESSKNLEKLTEIQKITITTWATLFYLNKLGNSRKITQIRQSKRSIELQKHLLLASKYLTTISDLI